MIRLALKKMKHRKSYFFINLFAMVSIFAIVPLGIFYAQESKLAAKMTIEEYGRGTYDILVRPGGTRTDIEKQLGVVEENYVGDSSGGISLEEWEKIKQHPDIEIAAPVSSLGYFAGNRTTVTLPYLDTPTRFKWQFFTSDGIHQYPIGDQHTTYYFKGDYYGQVDYTTDDWDVMGARMSPWMPEGYYLLVAIDVESESQLTGIDFRDL